MRFGKLPAFTHWLAFASPRGGLTRASPGAVGVPDVIHRGDVAWGKAMGVDAAVWTARFLRNDIVRLLACCAPLCSPLTAHCRFQGAKEVCDPFCGSGTVLAAANHLGLDALGACTPGAAGLRSGHDLPASPR